MWEAQCAAGDWRTHHLQQPDFSKRIPVKIFSSCSCLPSNRNKLLSWCLKNCLTVRNVVLGWHGGVILLSEWFIFSWNLKIASGLERGLRSYTEATFQGCCPYVSMFSVKPWLQSEKQHCVCVCVCVCARVGMRALDEITILRSESFNFELSRRVLYSCTAYHSDLLCLWCSNILTQAHVCCYSHPMQINVLCILVYTTLWFILLLFI